MLNLLRRAARGFVPLTVDANWRASDDIIWIDLVDPTPDEEAAVEAAYGIDLPTREEARRLEPSSRLYQEASATFLPPTLVASIHGMNFDILPELHWMMGYPWALLLMVISGVAPFLWFKKKGFL